MKLNVAYEKWLNDPNNNEIKEPQIFFQHHYFGKGWYEILADLAEQVIKLQEQLQQLKS